MSLRGLLLAGVIAGGGGGSGGIAGISLAGVSVPPDGFYSTRKLSTWNGNCCDVVLASDGVTSLTVGFVGNVINLAAINTFSSGAIVQVSKWYDQSGNTNDWTQTTAASRSRIDPTMPAAQCVVAFEQFDGVPNLNRFLSLPAGFAGNANAVSCLLAGRPLQSRAISTLGRFIAFGSAVTMQNTTAGFAVEGSGSNRSNIDVMCDYGVFGFRSGAGAISLKQPNHIENTIAPFTGTWAGVTLANDAGGTHQGALDIQALAIWKSGLSSGDYLAAESALNSALSYNTTFNRLVVWEGDSINEGVGSSLNRNIAHYARALFSSNVKLMNIATAGITLQSIIAATTRLDNALIEGYSNQVVITNAMTNDLAAGRTANQMYADLQTECGIIRGKGAKAVVTTMTPRGDMSAPVKAIYDDVTAQIRAGWTGFADALSDRQADPTVGTIASTSNTALYNDLVHPTSLCYSYLAPIDYAAIASLL